MARWTTPAALVVVLLGSGCDEPNPPIPMLAPPTPVPCDVANMPGVPVVALEWSELRETYLAPDHGSDSLGVDYFVSPRAHVDHVTLDFDFDRLTPGESVAFEGSCRLAFPIEPLLEVVPEGNEEIVAATVVASSESGTSRTGRVFVSTGTGEIEIRTEALEDGDPANGDWWFLFEPAAGAARLMIVPATLGRTTIRVSGLPVNQPGVVALIQTSALELDPSTRTVYAPWGFARDWRRYARGWYGAVLFQQPDTLLELATIVPPDSDVTSIHEFGDAAALAEGRTRALRTLPPGEGAHPVAIACDATAVAIDVLSFVELTADPGPDSPLLRPGASRTFHGACDPGETSWSLPIVSRSVNGRTGAVLLRRLDEVTL